MPLYTDSNLSGVNGCEEKGSLQKISMRRAALSMRTLSAFMLPCGA